MKKHIKQKAVLALLLLNLLVMTNSVAYAAENQIVPELAVKQTLEYKNAAAEQLNQTGTYELTRVTEDALMPENSENNSCIFSVKGIDEAEKNVKAFILQINIRGKVFRKQKKRRM